MEVTPEQSQFGTPAWLALQQRVLGHIQALPGVRTASWSTMSPFSGRNRGTGFYVPGFVSQAPRANEVHLVSVSPEYFETFGVRLAAGRAFTAADTGAAPKVAIVNESTARFYFGDRDPVGRMVGFTRQHEPDYRIVGVLKDAQHDSLRTPAGRFVYLPIPQSIDGARINRLALTVRATEDAGALVGPVQREVHRSDPGLLITNVATLQQQVDRSLLSERLISTLAAAFAVVALALACIGLYGILAYAVARRTRELGVRLALGATRGGVLWLVLREALILAGAGGLVGVPIAVWLGYLTRSLLFGVGPFDLPSMAIAMLLLLLFAVLAAVVPARRASRLDPMHALRAE
jgi:predicted permease